MTTDTSTEAVEPITTTTVDGQTYVPFEDFRALSARVRELEAQRAVALSQNAALKVAEAPRRVIGDAKDIHLTQEMVREVLDYNPETGLLRWKARTKDHFKTTEQVPAEVKQQRWNTRHAGQSAFTSTDKNGYKNGKLLGVKYQAHRLIWFMEFGFWPGVIDHINGDTSDNRIANLRACSVAENSRSSTNRRGGTSIFRGVSYINRDKVFVCQIQTDDGKSNLGRFSSEVKAALAYDEAALKHHGEFAVTNFSEKDRRRLSSCFEEVPQDAYGKGKKTAREEAAYIAGRQDAQLLCNLHFAGSNVTPPILTGEDDAQDAIAKARNAALEEAAQYIDHLSVGHANEIRSLKSQGEG